MNQVSKNNMRNGVFYLNNTGSRWVVLVNGKREKITLKTKSGNDVTRSVIFYESFGNFGSAYINYKGKRLRVLADSILED